MSFQLCFDYEQEVPTLKRLIALSAKTQWDVGDIDWTQRVGVTAYERILDWHGASRSDYVRRLPKRTQEQLARQFVAFDMSQVLHGEQAAMMLAGRLTGAVDDLDARIFAATQAKDEARHVMALREVVGRLGPIFECGPILRGMLNHLLECDLWPKQVLGLQLFLEARALLSFRQHLLFVKDPTFRDAIMRVERDESQHVAFGIQYLRSGIESLSPEQREELITYALFLDDNIWVLNEANEYRAVFEEIDLDFDEFRATYSAPSFSAMGMSPRAQKTVEAMHTQFAQWFLGAVTRVGLTEVVERRKGEAPLPDLTGIDPEALEEKLPWIES
ncbi:MAG: ferritin-like domain-containing protein [Deltaproteobacteria bacterium]